MIYFTSDTHFSHLNIIKYCNRPFQDVKEMNECLIKNWNKMIANDDTVYHLGDFCLASNEEIKEIFNRLNGHIILIRGNHDRKSVKYYESLGLQVLINAPIILPEYKLMLSHVPIPDEKIFTGYTNLHGHIHNKKLEDIYPHNYSNKKHINLSTDNTNFKPVSLEEILKIISSKN